MILILSQTTPDKTTEDVINWLRFYKVPFKRVNATDFIENVGFELKNGTYVFDENYENISVVWFRRFPILKSFEDNIAKSNLSNTNALAFSQHHRREVMSVTEAFFETLKNAFWLTKRSELRVSKLEVLAFAQKVQLKTPETLVTTKKTTLIEFKQKHQQIITKTIAQGIPSYRINNELVSLLTEEISDEDIEKLPNNFGLSLFQNKIKKQYEIRSFYVDGTFYSMCIFSQLDSQTATDFRNYNDEKPNRTIPYKLPQDVEVKLLKIIDNFNFTTGSFDLIRNLKGEYILLEVNPIGQLGMTSYPCNYNLEMKIADYLKSKLLN